MQWTIIWANIPWRIREQGQGGGPPPPAYTGPITDPWVRAFLEHLAAWNHEQRTGETPWWTPGNGGIGGIQSENDTRATVAPQETSEADTAPQNIPGVFPALPPNRADPGELRHWQALLNRVGDTRIKLLDSYFFLIYIFILLHFLVYIWFLSQL